MRGARWSNEGGPGGKRPTVQNSLQHPGISCGDRWRGPGRRISVDRYRIDMQDNRLFHCPDGTFDAVPFPIP